MRILDRIKVGIAKAFGASFFRFMSKFVEGKNLPFVSDTDLLESYEQSNLVRSALGKIAQRAGTIELELYRAKLGEAQEIDQHDILNLLAKPNPYMSGSDLFELVAIYEKCLGNAYVVKIKNESGGVFQLWPLRTDWVDVKVDQDGILTGYEYRSGQKKMTFKPEEVIHFRLANPLSHYIGAGYMQGLINIVMSDMYAQRWNAKFFLNSARPDGLLTTDADLEKNDREEMLKVWNETYGSNGAKLSAENAHKTALLSGGLHYEVVGNTHKDMDFTELRRANIDDVISTLGVPRSVLGITEEVTRANAETGVYVFLSETIEPMFRKWVEKLNHSLVPDFDMTLVLDFCDPTPEDQESLDTHHEKSLNKWMTVNEIRDERGMDPVEGGDVLYVPLGLVPIGEPISFANDPADNADQGTGEGKAMGKKVATGFVAMETKFISRKKRKLQRIYRLALRNNKLLRLQEELLSATIERATKMIKEKSAEHRAQKKSKWTKEERKMVWRIFDARLTKWELYWETFQGALFEGQRKRIKKQLMDSGLGEKSIIKAGELDFIDWEKEKELFEKKSKPVINEIVKEAGEYGMNQVGKYNFDPTDKKAAKWIQKKAITFASDVNATTKKLLKNSLAEGLLKGEGIPDLAKRVDEVMGNRIASSAKTIARTETLSSSNAGTLFGYEQSGIIQKKEWLATLDDKVRDAHASADGEVVATDESFNVDGEALDFPGDPKGSPENIINCRCTILPVITE